MNSPPKLAECEKNANRLIWISTPSDLTWFLMKRQSLLLPTIFGNLRRSSEAVGAVLKKMKKKNLNYLEGRGGQT